MIDWERERWGVKLCDRWGNLKNNETQIRTETNSHRCTQTDTHDVSTNHDTWRNGGEEAGRKKKKITITKGDLVMFLNIIVRQRIYKTANRLI